MCASLCMDRLFLRLCPDNDTYRWCEHVDRYNEMNTVVTRLYIATLPLHSIAMGMIAGISVFHLVSCLHSRHSLPTSSSSPSLFLDARLTKLPWRRHASAEANCSQVHDGMIDGQRGKAYIYIQEMKGRTTMALFLQSNPPLLCRQI